MPLAIVQQRNGNLSDARLKDVNRDVLDQITDLTTVMRDKNNIYKGDKYRLDSRPMASAGQGAVFVAGDYKVDIQTVAAQKKNSVTVAQAYVASDATNISLADFKRAMEESVNTKIIYRVT
jgi:hypothetical protein